MTAGELIDKWSKYVNENKDSHKRAPRIVVECSVLPGAPCIETPIEISFNKERIDLIKGDLNDCKRTN